MSMTEINYHMGSHGNENMTEKERSKENNKEVSPFG